MTSFPDEQPLSRRARRERLRAEQAQSDVLQTERASTAEQADAGEAVTAPETANAPEPHNGDRAEADEKPNDAPVSDTAQDGKPSRAGTERSRPLTRRQLREQQLVANGETGSQPVVPEPIAPEPEKPVPAQPEREKTTAQPNAERGAAKPATKTEKPAGKQKSTEQAAIEPAPTTAVTSHKQKSTSPPKSSALREPAVADIAQPIARATKAPDAPQLSPAFGAALHNQRDHESAPPGFDAIIAPEARSSEALTTSSVLILPNLPEPQRHVNVPGTGEIIVTGSVDLPSTGAESETRNGVDRTDIDSGLDKHGNAPATAGTPVSATKAVSTHTATRDVITPPTKSTNSRLLMMLAITAGVLCVAVIGVVIVGLMTGAF